MREYNRVQFENNRLEPSIGNILEFSSYIQFCLIGVDYNVRIYDRYYRIILHIGSLTFVIKWNSGLVGEIYVPWKFFLTFQQIYIHWSRKKEKKNALKVTVHFQFLKVIYFNSVIPNSVTFFYFLASELPNLGCFC